MPKVAIAIDFDGVIHNDSSVAWTGIGSVRGVMKRGADTAITRLAETYTIIIFTCRACHPRGVHAVKRALRAWGIPYDSVTDKKPHAVMYIDDRGYHFSNWDTAMQDMRHLL